MKDINFIIVHHSGTDDDGFQNNTESIKDWHVNNNGWDDIGYNFLIEKENYSIVLQVGRPLSNPGAHCREAGHNHDSVGVCVVGNYSADQIPADYWHKLVNVVAGLALMFDVPTKNILGHKETGANTDCPGKCIDMAALRRSVAKKLTKRRVCFAWD